jgi:hypothetical protein
MTLACGGGPASSGGPREPSVTPPSETPSASPSPGIDGVALAEAAVARLQGDPFIGHVEQDWEGTVVDAPDEPPWPPGTIIKSHMVADLDGDDMHVMTTEPASGDGTMNLEFWGVGDDAWVQQSGSQLVPMNHSDAALRVDGVFRAIRVTDDPRLLSYTRPETIDGRVVHHLTAAPGAIGPFDALDLYVQADGTPVRLTGTVSGEWDGGYAWTGTVTTVYSSFGGPVTIEPPTESAASPGAE